VPLSRTKKNINQENNTAVCIKIIRPLITLARTVRHQGSPRSYLSYDSITVQRRLQGNFPPHLAVRAAAFGGFLPSMPRSPPTHQATMQPSLGTRNSLPSKTVVDPPKLPWRLETPEGQSLWIPPCHRRALSDLRKVARTASHLL